MINEREYRHPSFGIVSISRVNCSKSSCFMAEQLEMGGHIQIKIREAYLSRNLSKSQVFPAGMIISLRLSYHQFAELITNLNSSSRGIPCTLEWVTPTGKGEVEAYSPPPPTKTEFETDLRNNLAQGLKSLEELEAVIKALTTKGKAGKNDLAELKSKVDAITRSLTSDTVWIEKSFQEAMEDAVNRSKIEATAWIEDQMRQLGLQVIAEGNNHLELPSGSNGNKEERADKADS